MIETIYSSESRLRSPRRFVDEMKSDLRASRSMAWHLFVRNVRAQYRQSVLGYVWIVLPPVTTMLLWVYLNWTKTLAVGQTDIPYPVFVLTGTMLWQAFSDAIYCPLNQLNAQRNLISKVRLPHEAILLSGLGIILFNFAVRLVLLLIAMLVLHVPFTSGLLLAPIGVAMLMLFGLTLGLLLAPIGLLYQDITMGLNLIMSFAFFVTPIVYPVPTKWPASLLANLNPVTPLLNTARDWLARGPVAPGAEFYIVCAITIVLSLVSWVVYRIAAPHFISRF